MSDDNVIPFEDPDALYMHTMQHPTEGTVLVLTHNGQQIPIAIDVIEDVIKVMRQVRDGSTQ